MIDFLKDWYLRLFQFESNKTSIMPFLKIILSILFFSCFLAPAYSQEARMIKLSGKQIKSLLTSRKANFLKPYQGSYQLFYRSGLTVQVKERAIHGEWKVIENQFCSIWTDSYDWECYSVYGSLLNNGNWKISWVNKEANFSHSAIIDFKKRK